MAYRLTKTWVFATQSRNRYIVLGIFALLSSVVWEKGWSEHRSSLLEAFRTIAFTDPKGERINVHPPFQGPVIVYFFFSKCPTICPLMTPSLHRILRAVDGRLNIHIYGITVAPEEDTPSILEAFRTRHFSDESRILLLNPGLPGLSSLVKIMNLIPEVKQDPSLHSTRAFVFDNEGNFRKAYDLADTNEVGYLIAGLLSR